MKELVKQDKKKEVERKMLSVENRIANNAKKIKLSKTTGEADKYYYISITTLEVKYEDGKISSEKKNELMEIIKNEYRLAERRIRNKTIDATLDLFRQEGRKGDGKRRRQGISCLQGGRKRNMA